MILKIECEIRKMSKRKISENYEKIIKRAAAAKHKAMQEEKAAKLRETKNKEKSLERATEFIVEKLHKAFGIYLRLVITNAVSYCMSQSV